MTEAQKRLAEIAAAPDEGIDLAEAALVVALEEYPKLDRGAYLRRLDELAAAVRRRIPASLPPSEQIARLNHFLFVECGFSGAADDYYDPRSSFLNEVLDRRIGIPISLSVVYCEVAKRIDVAAVGVGFPGHFLVKTVGEPEIFVDPFFGAVITPDECERRLQTIYGPDARLRPELLRAATPREILVRMLRNLKQIYMRQSDPKRALSCTDRILLFAPTEVEELRDRGTLYLRLECFAAALKDFERALELNPQGEAADDIRSLLPELRRRAAQYQ